MTRGRARLRLRSAFALLAVLWVMTAASLLAITMRVAAGDAIAATRNRIHLSRAAWIAEGCVEHARAAIGDALRTEQRAASAWNDLEAVVAAVPAADGCEVGARPSGITVSVNDSIDAMRGLLRAIGEAPERADSLVDALADWQDADDSPRLGGAERAWYESRRRTRPRNGPLGAAAELKLVRGFEQLSQLDSLVGVERERIVLGRAPLAVVAALPGMTSEAVARVAQSRAAGETITDLTVFANALSGESRDVLLAHYAELVGRTALTPDAWTLTGSASAGEPPVRATVELRIVRDGTRAAIVRRRSWP